MDQWSESLKGVERGVFLNNTFALYARILHSRHEISEHYYIYDVNSLIADIGGFLGLLLGQSLFGIYSLGEGYIFSAIERMFRGKNN